MRTQNYRMGDHLKVFRFGYTHHMLYIGNSQVIHYSGWANGPFDNANAKVEVAFLGRVVGTGRVSVVQHKRRRYSGRKAVDRAMKRLGEREYNLLTNNCEHFVNWAILGKQRSAQVALVTAAVDIALDPVGPLVDSIAGETGLLRPRVRVLDAVNHLTEAKEKSITARFGFVAGPPIGLSSIFKRMV